MPAGRVLLAAAVLAWAIAPAAAADHAHCLTKEQQRAAIANGKAMRLAAVFKMARGRQAGDVVRARLCEQAQGLVYMLTMLGRDGKVTRLNVDAASGNVMGGS